jgi:phosphoglycolate phosphatase
MFDSLSFAGAVDTEIVGRALALAGIPPTPRRVGRMRSVYGRRLKRSLPQRRGSVCPGVPEALTAVAQRAQLGLLTGNWPEGAWTKLEVYRLKAFFAGCVGAYGGDADRRDDLLPVAVRRARRRFGAVDKVVLIGDTPADVRCARAGARALGSNGPEVIAVAVQTGFAEPDTLAAAGPDLLLADLSVGLPDLLSCL